jgi:hypothetical protein
MIILKKKIRGVNLQNVLSYHSRSISSPHLSLYGFFDFFLSFSQRH